MGAGPTPLHKLPEGGLEVVALSGCIRSAWLRLQGDDNTACRLHGVRVKQRSATEALASEQHSAHMHALDRARFHHPTHHTPLSRPAQDLSNAARVAAVYKLGGMYLDSDIIMMGEQMAHRPMFLAKQVGGWGACVMGDDERGRCVCRCVGVCVGSWVEVREGARYWASKLPLPAGTHAHRGPSTPHAPIPRGPNAPPLAPEAFPVLH